MRRSFPFLVIALMLALLLPLEQAHCLWMGSATSRAPHHGAMVKMAADHSCCRGHARPRSNDADPCACMLLPHAAVPATIAVASPASVAVTFVVPAAIASLVAPDAIERARPPDPGRERPPLDLEPGAQLLRAPPTLA
jgi:hypothetical protein